MLIFIISPLTDINTWLNDYFDMNVITNQNFVNAISALDKATISVLYPAKLASLANIRDLLSNQTKTTPPKNANKEKLNNPKQEIEAEPTEKQPDDESKISTREEA